MDTSWKTYKIMEKEIAVNTLIVGLGLSHENIREDISETSRVRGFQPCVVREIL